MPMTDHKLDTPPDHLSNDPRSKFHDPAVLERGIGNLASFAASRKLG